MSRQTGTGYCMNENKSEFLLNRHTNNDNLGMLRVVKLYAF